MDKPYAQDPVDLLAARVRAREPFSRDEFDAVVAVLRMWLSRRSLRPEDLEEVAADAVMRLVTAIEADRLDLRRPLGAWLRVVADHLAVDMLRQRQRRGHTLEFDERIHDAARDDERIVAMIGENVAADDVARAMRTLADAGRQNVVRVVATWLDLAGLDGKAPSSRRVAERMGTSHTSVQRALNVFTDLLREEGFPITSPMA